MNEPDPSYGDALRKSYSNTLRKNALWNMRVIWLSLVIGQIMFLLAVACLGIPGRRGVNPLPILMALALIFPVAVIPGSFIARMIIFRRTCADGRLSPATYFTGNIIFWAGCESVTFFGLIVATVNGNLWPTIIVVAIALALFALTFPMANRISDDSGS
ncbi:MAG TPA: hypothetical protein VFW23_16565 [Tepidisphaeraceae bacterium]|nr:hypothetical protein [Tepidisphaeraceae bacterium]